MGNEECPFVSFIEGTDLFSGRILAQKGEEEGTDAGKQSFAQRDKDTDESKIPIRVESFSVQKRIEDVVDGIADAMRRWNEKDFMGIVGNLFCIMKAMVIEEGGQEEGSDEIGHQDIENSRSSSVCKIGDEAVAEVVGTGCENQNEIVGEIIDELRIVDDGLDILVFLHALIGGHLLEDDHQNHDKIEEGDDDDLKKECKDHSCIAEFVLF